MKYRFKRPDGTPVDETVEDTWRRVARTLAAVEAPGERARWEETFFDVMAGYRFLPAGRILAGAGTGRSVTLFNCFVMGTLDDSMPGIFQGLKEAALTLQQGGGIGHDFSTLRPSGAPVAGVGADASGPLSFMDVWDAMCRTIMSAGSRRGAMMATMRCDHPDIEAFVDAKRDPKRLRNFNLSVLVTDAFMAALETDADWPLVFAGETYKVVKARALWDRIMRATYDSAEPGVVFIDRVNEANNLGYCETIHATNPCGEQPLPPYGACLLGSVNLASLVRAPFDDEASLDLAELDRTVAVAVRMMDNVIETSNYPLPEQAREAKAKRRIGLGLTGLATRSPCAGCATAPRPRPPRRKAGWRRWKAPPTGEHRAGQGARGFPLFEADAYLASGHVRGLPEPLRRDIAKHGIRNALVTSIAPTGTISLFAGNVSSGVEPVFALRYERKVLLADGSHRIEPVEDRALSLYRERFGPRTGAAGLFRHRPDARAGGPPAHAGGAAGPRRFLDLQDHQLPRLHRLRRLQGGVPGGLRPRPQGLHHLSAEPDHRRGPVVERRPAAPGPAGAAARGAGGRAGRRRATSST
jgi:ribonucleoside-diphosphate reductase alpha chain